MSFLVLVNVIVVLEKKLLKLNCSLRKIAAKMFLHQFKVTLLFILSLLVSTV